MENTIRESISETLDVLKHCPDSLISKIPDKFLNYLKENSDEEYKTDWSKVPVDTPILVKDTLGSRWKHRYFAKYENGKVFAWADGVTSWSTANSGFANDWKYAELYDNKKEN